MTSRLEKPLLLLMLVACCLMAALLVRIHHHHTRHPIAAPPAVSIPLSQSPAEPRTRITLMMPDDKTGMLDSVTRTLSMPAAKTARARALIEELLASWRAPHSPHPVQASAGVNSVFLLPIPGHPRRRLAVVNLNRAFPRAQPSGIEPETLTLLSIIQTLHANLPSVDEIRFLVNGKTRATLAGHASLLRTYLAQTIVSGPKS